MPGSKEILPLLLSSYEVFITTAAMEYPRSFAAKYELFGRSAFWQGSAQSGQVRALRARQLAKKFVRGGVDEARVTLRRAPGVMRRSSSRHQPSREA